MALVVVRRLAFGYSAPVPSAPWHKHMHDASECALTPRVRDMVEPEHGVRAVLLRREVEREERVPVVDEQRDRPLHVVRAEERAHGLVALLLVRGLVQLGDTLLGVDALCFAATARGRRMRGMGVFYEDRKRERTRAR